MRFNVRTLAVVAVALMVALSGCSALEGVTESQSNETADLENESVGGTETNETEDENESTSPDDELSDEGTADTDDPTNETEEENATGDEADNTADAEWYPPEEPNRPLEDKREDRIESVEFVDTEPAADGEGYSNFNLEVVVNTSMERVDPAEHGDVVGEPYFFVKINEDEQKIVERTEHVRMAENGTFHIEVRPAGIEAFGEGPLTVEVFLMDEDKDWDDIYDSVGTEIYFNPESSADSDDDGDDREGTESATTTEDDSNASEN
ncbi:hypothetical protein [Halopiger aswanensis]|nr:hypothetical protein [Halopiger aswanensis]